MQKDRLNNPLWAALTSGHAHLAQVLGDMRRYDPAVAPFAAVPEDGLFLRPTDLEYLTTDTFFLGAIPTVPDGWRMTELSGVLQMVYRGGPVTPPAPDGILALDPLDPAMVELTDIAFPGYFRSRTGTMGRYAGIHDAGRLIALSGERMDLGDLREVSAVCTHPDFTGRGYAKRLVRHVMHGIQADGVTPMLHVGERNDKAIALYEALGFARNGVLRHTRLDAQR